MNVRIYGLAIITSLLGVCSFAAIAQSQELAVDKDIVFGTIDGVELKLDLYRQRSHVDNPKSVQPGLVVIFGGGFRIGNKETMRVFSEQFARAGFVVAAVNYRLLPKYPFPAPVDDVRCAVRWMRAHAVDYRIDADHLGAMGISAGGYLALMLGLLDDQSGFEAKGGYSEYPSQVQAVVSYAGAFDLTLQDWDPAFDEALVEFVTGRIAEIPEEYRRASPSTYVSKGDAPSLLIHGTKDTVVPYGQSVLAYSALIDAGVASQLKLVHGAGHGWWGKDLQETQRLAIEFFHAHLDAQ